MSNQIAKRGLIIGAGIGGLAAAAALAPFFEKVTLLERDHLPDRAEPRAGVPQGWQAHGLLAGGLRALAQLFPLLEPELAAAGAVRVNVSRDTLLELPFNKQFPQRDLGVSLYALSRPLLELLVRRQVNRIGNVDIRSGFNVRSLLLNREQTAVAGLKGECNREVETLTADLIIDATHWGKPTRSLLKLLQREPPPETTIGIDLGYASARFEMPADAGGDWKTLTTMPSPLESRSAGLIIPLEGDCWMVGLAGRQGDYPPEDEAGFRAFARALRTPTLYNAIEGARLLGGIKRFRVPDSRLRHFERLAGFPKGLLPLGDAICKFNPIHGQGMSVAAMEAVALAAVLREHAGAADPLRAIAFPYFRKVADIVETPWMLAAIPDLSYPGTLGHRPAEFEAAQQRALAITDMAIEEPEILKLVFEVTHLLKPRGAYAQSAVLQARWKQLRAEENIF